MTGLLGAWLTSMHDYESTCYWPGPRPMDEGDRSEHLVGRDQTIRDFADAVGDNPLIVFSGPSGVGKSSVLNRGIRPYLRDQGFVVLTCNEWGGTGEDVGDIESFLHEKLSHDLPNGIDAEESFVDQLDARFGARAVVILDQFEELIRHEPKLFARVTEWVDATLAETNVRVVISLREEFVPRLRVLEAGGWERKDIALEPLADAETIGEIVRAAHHEGDPRARGEDLVDDAAVARIQQLWVDAEGGTPESGVGLLHLQSILYTLWRRVTEQNRSGVVRLTDVTQLIDPLTKEYLSEDETAGSREKARGVFRLALADVVDLRLQLSEEKHRQIGGDPTLAVGVLSVITRMAMHLASGGYKVDQDRWHLAELVLDKQLDTLGYVDEKEREQAKAIFDAVSDFVDRANQAIRQQRTDQGEAGEPDDGDDDPLDYLTASRAELVVDYEGPRLVPTGSMKPWEADPDEVSAGMMMGAQSWEVLVEEYRRYFFAIDWLNASHLLRQSSRSDETTVSLIHDGFGVGLEDWSDKREDNPVEWFALLNAAVGEVFEWASIDGTKTADGGGLSFALTTNIRWKSCLIKGTRFTGITFVNCDFRSSVFQRCRFSAVAFVNCLMDGVRFEACIFEGAIDEGDEYRMPVLRFPDGTIDPKSTELPSFALWGDRYPQTLSVVAALDRYRESRGAGEQLYSLTSGYPARGRDTESAYAVRRPTGGMVMYGGRLSSLVVNNCAFVESGQLALRHVAGTSLELTEQADGDFELFDVWVRGLSVSERVDGRSSGRIRMEITESKVQNVWISTGLDGTVIFDRSTVWQLVNAGDGVELDWGVDTRVYGFLEVDDAMGAELKRIASEIDYRSTPAKREIEQRGSRRTADPA